MSYTLRTVLLGSMLLCGSAGLVGAFMMLRRRSLISDVVGHSALPGLAIAFLTAEAVAPGTGRNPAWLILGAMASGLLGAIAVLVIDRTSRLKADAALAIVLSVFYGAGTALLTVVQNIPQRAAASTSAGLTSYLAGTAAATSRSDVLAFAAVAAALIAVTLLFFKELTLLCFDADFAAAEGLPVRTLDVLLTGLVVGVTILGMESVGLILVVATLVIPPSAARFWTDDMRIFALLSLMFGMTAAATGSLISASFAKVPVGPTIVLCGATLFAASVVFGTRRGLIATRRGRDAMSEPRVVPTV